jgi:hypothetical protein
MDSFEFYLAAIFYSNAIHELHCSTAKLSGGELKSGLNLNYHRFK